MLKILEEYRTVKVKLLVLGDNTEQARAEYEKGNFVEIASDFVSVDKADTIRDLTDMELSNPKLKHFSTMLESFNLKPQKTKKRKTDEEHI